MGLRIPRISATQDRVKGDEYQRRFIQDPQYPHARRLSRDDSEVI
ncbi:MAG: hypothetical protein J07HQX50_02531 [Haloquadratum sp. J07HQX50]|nr:MAG: hypothetical protein J07HQX50_02531 [Haloquadratum sp. J07HQX50]